MNQRTAIQRVDFEAWARLAKQDPHTFEKLRNRLLDAHIARASSAHQDRLRRLQWRIDRLREQASNPMAACVQISNLMWTTFDRLGKAYHDPQVVLPKEGPPQLPNSNTVVPFKSR
jgi:hypothetical protein